MEDTAESLEQRQDALQAEVRQVESDLRLDSLLEQVGRPVRVGSAALGLMVWRDLDITVICAKLDIGPVTKIGATLGSHPRIREVLFRDDTGSWNTDPAYPDGVYLGIAYRAPSGDDWKIDIWFVDEPERQPDLAHLQSIPPALNSENREAILRIKTVWSTRPEYRRSVTSFDVYTAVIHDGVRTLDQFDEWLTTKPGT